MKSIIIKLTVPDEVEPYDVLNSMIDDFFYSNRNTDDYGPHMENIKIVAIGSVAETPSEE